MAQAPGKSSKHSSDSPRVVVLAVDYPPSVGGAQTYLAGLVGALDLPKLKVFAPGAPTPDCPPEVTRVGFGGADPLARMGVNLRMFLEAARLGLDVVIAGHVLLLPATLALSWRCRARSIAIVYGSELRSRRSVWLTAPLLRQVDDVVAISNFTAGEAERLGVRQGRITILRPAVDPPLDAAGYPVLGSHSIPPYLLFVGRMDDLHKGQDVAIAALREVRMYHPKVSLVLVGDGAERETLEAQAKALGLSDAVRFTGTVSDREKHRLLQHATALALLSRTDSRGRVEGFGISVLEAASYGVPAVVGASGGLPDAVEDGQTGLIVHPTDVHAVASAFREILSEGTAARLGVAARARTIERFTWTGRKRELRELLSPR